MHVSGGRGEGGMPLPYPYLLLKIRVLAKVRNVQYNKLTTN